jgi:hypothetical protein
MMVVKVVHGLYNDIFYHSFGHVLMISLTRKYLFKTMLDYTYQSSIAFSSFNIEKLKITSNRYNMQFFFVDMHCHLLKEASK